MLHILFSIHYYIYGLIIPFYPDFQFELLYIFTNYTVKKTYYRQPSIDKIAL